MENFSWKSQSNLNLLNFYKDVSLSEFFRYFNLFLVITLRIINEEAIMAPVYNLWSGMGNIKYEIIIPKEKIAASSMSFGSSGFNFVKKYNEIIELKIIIAMNLFNSLSVNIHKNFSPRRLKYIDKENGGS